MDYFLGFVLGRKLIKMKRYLKRGDLVCIKDQIFYVEYFDRTTKYVLVKNENDRDLEYPLKSIWGAMKK